MYNMKTISTKLLIGTRKTSLKKEYVYSAMFCIYFLMVELSLRSGLTYFESIALNALPAPR